MRARYEVTYNGNDTVDLKLSGVTILGYEQSDPERSDDHVTLGMSADAFEFLTGDKVRSYLKSSLDDALDQVQRLSDDRDRWQQEAERLKKEDDERRKAWLGPIVWHTTASDDSKPVAPWEDYVRALRGPDEVEELKAVIVSQAREIARLKGESE